VDDDRGAGREFSSVVGMRIAVEPEELPAATRSLDGLPASIAAVRARLQRVVADAGAWADPLVWERLQALVDALDVALRDLGGAASDLSSGLRAAQRTYGYVDGTDQR
jgi:hypothetical protein